MSIVFVGVAPHPPLLIPTIGKQHINELKSTIEAFRILEQELYAAKPDSLIILSPHGPVSKDVFQINLSNEYIGTLKEFGDYSTKLKIKCDIPTIQMLRSCGEITHENNMQVALTSIKDVDYGVTVPFYYLLKHLKSLPAIIIYPSLQNYREHYQFGVFLKEKLNIINKRFAIIASADLSHKCSKKSPGGLSEEAVAFDKLLIEDIIKHNINKIITRDKKNAQDIGECALEVIMIMLGILHHTSYRAELLSHEYPFGVGHCVMNFQIQG